MKLIDSKELKRRILDGCFLPDWVRVLINRVIDDMPDMNAEPVVHAKWVYKRSFAGENCYVCNRCGRALWNTLDFQKTVERYPYCHCGARMDEVIKDGKS